METKELKKQISVLPADQREEIAEYAFKTLNQPDAEIEKTWIKEVDRRAAEVDSGKVELIPGEQVMERLRKITSK